MIGNTRFPCWRNARPATPRPVSFARPAAGGLLRPFELNSIGSWRTAVETQYSYSKSSGQASSAPHGRRARRYADWFHRGQHLLENSRPLRAPGRQGRLPIMPHIVSFIPPGDAVVRGGRVATIGGKAVLASNRLRHRSAGFQNAVTRHFPVTPSIVHCGGNLLLRGHFGESLSVNFKSTVVCRNTCEFAASGTNRHCLTFAAAASTSDLSGLDSPAT